MAEQANEVVAGVAQGSIVGPPPLLEVGGQGRRGVTAVSLQTEVEVPSSPELSLLACPPSLPLFSPTNFLLPHTYMHVHMCLHIEAHTCTKHDPPPPLFLPPPPSRLPCTLPSPHPYSTLIYHPTSFFLHPPLASLVPSPLLILTLPQSTTLPLAPTTFL